MSKPIITVENLSKAYRIGAKDEVADTLVGALTNSIRYPLRNLSRLRNLSNIREGDEGEDILWALKDVSFEVNEGEVVGIIGRNGAGKSTLLKILSRITEPTSGRAVIRGRVSSLLEVGTGFHPELTGRENIYMNGTILGMTKREIDRKFDEIVDFSGVEKFLDTPTKRYSSGMQVRLAFAVAAHLEPEILIIDEVLAVGDAEFQKKCLGKMQDVADGGRTVLFVSHNMAAVESLCTRSILVDEGSVRVDGKTAAVLKQYLSTNKHLSSLDLIDRRDRKGTGEVRFARITLTDSVGKPIEQAPMGEDLHLSVSLKCDTDILRPQMGFVLRNPNGVRVCRVHSSENAATLPPIYGDAVLHLTIKSPALCAGAYSLTCGISDSGGGQYDFVEDAATIVISPSDVFGTGKAPGSEGLCCFFSSEWELKASETVCAST